MSAIDEYENGSKSDFVRYAKDHEISEEEARYILNAEYEYAGKYSEYCNILSGKGYSQSSETYGDSGTGEPGNYAASY